jgi:UDP-N-acetylglucosamine 1-carboxyvinyltransferase
MTAEKFVIMGGYPLAGTFRPAGNKNAALPLLAACLLSASPIILHNVPLIQDVLAMRRLLESLGTTVTELAPNTWQLLTPEIVSETPDFRLCQQIRASILLAGPVCARHGRLQIPPPGGDVIGRRRLDTHLLALQALGVRFSFNENLFYFESAATGLRGADILLDEASVTATENAITAAVLAQGTTVLRNAASEPHVQELCWMLNAMGAQIRGIGSNVLEITGVSTLHGAEFTIGPDYLEVVSFAAAAAITGGSLLIENAGVEHLAMVGMGMRKLGLNWEVRGHDLWIPPQQTLQIVPDFGNAIPKIEDAPWPGFPADLLSIAIVVATQSEGTILFHEKMYESRLFFTDKLVGMGARIVLCDPHRCLIQGKTVLNGERLDSPDIRAGMALLIASLAAKGKSTIRNIRQIDRGYQQVDAKLRALGANIERLPD